ncbi:nucleotidyltransferase family protein [Veronia pacifica]|uniref:Nucleotidyltransferase family protein n=1 Tax=Veronia pacifica TaxID=1080227 RepID=A0A1C3EAL2_9GAMM|nr:nucleotidyltransferase family protein [Veronia pacifica]ODA30286.1 hypothetical protein A8L45_20360 [Veronia pacifica]
MKVYRKDNQLLDIIRQSPELVETIRVCSEIKLPNYYLAGGAITQCIWNYLSERPLLENVKDLDVVYFEPKTHSSSENNYAVIASQRVSHHLPIDIKNQANIHTWYERKFGQRITPYECVEVGIDSWLPAFAVGVRYHKRTMNVYAPFGLEDMFNMIVRPNKRAMSKTNYDLMCDGYSKRWPQLEVIGWDDI